MKSSLLQSMNQENSSIKIIVCVPYVRTFVVLVRKNQKINIIKEAFPNIDHNNNLIYWYEGSQLSPSSTFEETSIREYSAIIVTVQTDNISFNRHFMKISKYGNIKKVLNKMIKNDNKENKNPDQQIIPKKYNFERDKKKYFFIQDLKQLLNQFDFSKNNNNSNFENIHTSINTNPIPV